MAQHAPAPQMTPDRLLPEPLPPEPISTLAAWLDEAVAKGHQPNPNAVTLATVDASGIPDARIVLCKAIDADRGAFSFFTNRRSAKGEHLAANPYCAMVFFWDHLHLQARARGPVTTVSGAESDEYFRSRWLMSRIGATASEQSKPIASRAALLRKVEETAARLGVPTDAPETADVPRPPHWGGYRLWAREVELWIGQPGRIHDRARWTRTLSERGDGFDAGPWSASRLQP